MKLLFTWEFGVYLYQLWDMPREYVCLCIHTETLQTIYEVGGNTPLEALYAGSREALALS